jgi:hypothetical protein
MPQLNLDSCEAQTEELPGPQYCLRQPMTLSLCLVEFQAAPFMLCQGRAKKMLFFIDLKIMG